MGILLGRKCLTKQNMQELIFHSKNKLANKWKNMVKTHPEYGIESKKSHFQTSCPPTA